MCVAVCVSSEWLFVYCVSVCQTECEYVCVSVSLRLCLCKEKGFSIVQH